MSRDKYKKIVVPLLNSVLRRLLVFSALLCRMLPRSWVGRVIHHLGKILTTMKRAVPYLYTTGPDQRLEPEVLSMVLNAFTKRAGPFQFPYRAVGGDLVRAVHSDHGGLVLCGFHAFPLNRLVHNLVRDLGLETVQVIDPGNPKRLGLHVWGRGDLLKTVPVTLNLLVRLARCLRRGSVVVILPDWGEGANQKVCPRIFEFAASIGVPVLFYATRVAQDDIPEVIIESPPHPTESKQFSCIEAYRSFVARHAGIRLEVERAQYRFRQDRRPSEIVL